MKTIYAIPGLGTTKELFRNISVPGHALKILEWPVPEGGSELEDYACAFMDQIDRSAPVTLLGVSFGGMLCAELAEKIPVNKVFLVSSSINRKEFPLSLKLLKSIPVYQLVPDAMIRLLARNKRRFLGFEKSFEPVFFGMIDQMPKNYFKHCIHYIINWKRTGNTASIIRIHGTADRLLHYRRSDHMHTIEGGSHSMVLNRAGEINHILNQELNGSSFAS